MKILIGLGNPGNQYEKTRHNIGFRIVESFVKRHSSSEWKESSKFDSLLCELQTACSTGSRLSRADCQLIAVKPQCFMNLSGKSVKKLVNYYKLDPSTDILIVFDDKDMVFGKIRERNEGSSGGHNGIKSIITELGREDFPRLKFGVGHEDQQIPTDAFVLQNFSEEEEERLATLIDEAVKKIEDWLSK